MSWCDGAGILLLITFSADFKVGGTDPVSLDHLYVDPWKWEALHQYLDQSLALLSESHHQYSYAGWDEGVVTVGLPICYRCYSHAIIKRQSMSVGDLVMIKNFQSSYEWPPLETQIPFLYHF